LIAVVSPRGSSFKHLLRYLEFGRDGKQRGRAAWMEFHNLATHNPMLAACFMAATAAGSVSGTEKPVYHFSVGFDIDDPVDEAIMRRVAERTRRDMGLLEYQCVVVAHQDRSHLHLHFVVNRVHPERRTLWRDWQDYYRLERSLRAQEVELGLRIVPGWNAPVQSLARDRDGLGAQPQNERRIKPSSGPRRGDEAFLRDMIVRAAPVLRADSWAEIERGLTEEGLTLRSKGGGFIVTDGKHWVKASEVGRACSRYHLEKRLGRWPDYRARMAVAAMARPEPAVQLARGVSQPEVSAPTVESLPPAVEPDTSAPTTSPALEWNSQARLRSRKPQFGDAGNGIVELFGYSSARQEKPLAPALDAEPVSQLRPSIDLPIASAISALDAGLTQQPHDQEEDVPLGEPAEVIQPHAPTEAIQPAAPAVTIELTASVEAPQPAAPVEAIQHTAPAEAAKATATVDKHTDPSRQSRPRRRVDFLQEVKDRAGPVLQLANSWDELVRGLAERGLSLRVKGGGFTITDGAMEVKASMVGRAFSRFYLEERLGRYPAVDVAAPEISAAAPPPTVQPHVLEEAHAYESPEPPASPEGVVQSAASPDIGAAETPEPKRFGLFEVYGTFGVEDRATGEVYFVETRDRAVAEVKFANEMAEHHPHSLSVDHLRALDNAWADAHGMPRWSDPQGYGTVPSVAGSIPELIEHRTGAASVRSLGRPEGDAASLPTEAAEPMLPGRPQPLSQPVVPWEPAVPVRKKVRPPTRREEYETALVNLTGELKVLFFDPHAVRRAFAEDACVNGREHALRTLGETPEQYGRLSFIAKRERLPEAVRWGGVYATWQEERTRPATRRAAALYRQATQTEAMDRLLRDAKDVADQKAREIASIKERFAGAKEAVGKVQEGAGEVYVEPHDARRQIIAGRKTKGLDEVVHTLRHTPERFGELRAEKQMFGSLRTPNTSAARTRAKTLANEVRAAYTALAERPKTGDLERAEEAHGEAIRAVGAARDARRKLPDTSPADSEAEAGGVLRRAARDSVARAEHMADQLAKMLPADAITLARKALNLARGAEHDQHRERRGNTLGF
jgi:hypothetical protein